ncbi:uncharacterized protein J8A68_000600 [[Candida] subhashii]|uniref:SCP domain-containing protein n=1 Tax=[Candida] subhashii TaxID=561895 RepID=A0A8J5QV37_9ASCO|nr:uncharacterized protein J8A68_000600 [[Candida] subhashii]KAG7665775.1 hypothetical protein J8A68_000600 [[Candida] subhashii]
MKLSRTLTTFAATLAVAQAATLTIEVTVTSTSTYLMYVTTTNTHYVFTTIYGTPPGYLLRTTTSTSTSPAESSSDVAVEPTTSSSSSPAEASSSSTDVVVEPTTNSPSSPAEASSSSTDVVVEPTTSSTSSVAEEPSVPSSSTVITPLEPTSTDASSTAIDIDTPTVVDSTTPSSTEASSTAIDIDTPTVVDTSTSSEASTGPSSSSESSSQSSTSTEPSTPTSVADNVPTYDIEWSQEILAAHNFYRAQHGVPNLVWSNEAYEYGRAYAESSYDCSGTLVHSTSSTYGENLAAGYQGVNAVDAWYEEIDDYDFNDPGYVSGTGHFTQLVWKSTTKVGCFRLPCEGYDYNQYTICEYWEHGNLVTSADNRGTAYFVANVLPLLQEPWVLRPGSDIYD